MEVVNEISLKIRTAIKAKLIELGIFIGEEELPDYIMVMVANKRSEEQMNEDLTLFLGESTEIFTSWLHGLLARLQSVASEPITVMVKPIESTDTPNSKSGRSSASVSDSESASHSPKKMASLPRSGIKGGVSSDAAQKKTAVKRKTSAADNHTSNKVLKQTQGASPSSSNALQSKTVQISPQKKTTPVLAKPVKKFKPKAKTVSNPESPAHRKQEMDPDLAALVQKNLDWLETEDAESHVASTEQKVPEPVLPVQADTESEPVSEQDKTHDAMSEPVSAFETETQKAESEPVPVEEKVYESQLEPVLIAEKTQETVPGSEPVVQTDTELKPKPVEEESDIESVSDSEKTPETESELVSTVEKTLEDGAELVSAVQKTLEGDSDRMSESENGMPDVESELVSAVQKTLEAGSELFSAVLTTMESESESLPEQQKAEKESKPESQTESVKKPETRSRLMYESDSGNDTELDYSPDEEPECELGDVEHSPSDADDQAEDHSAQAVAVVDRKKETLHKPSTPQSKPGKDSRSSSSCVHPQKETVSKMKQVQTNKTKSEDLVRDREKKMSTSSSVTGQHSSEKNKLKRSGSSGEKSKQPSTKAQSSDSQKSARSSNTQESLKRTSFDFYEPSPKKVKVSATAEKSKTVSCASNQGATRDRDKLKPVPKPFEPSESDPTLTRKIMVKPKSAVKRSPSASRDTKSDIGLTQSNSTKDTEKQTGGKKTSSEKSDQSPKSKVNVKPYSSSGEQVKVTDTKPPQPTATKGTSRDGEKHKTGSSNNNQKSFSTATEQALPRKVTVKPASAVKSSPSSDKTRSRGKSPQSSASGDGRDSRGNVRDSGKQNTCSVSESCQKKVITKSRSGEKASSQSTSVKSGIVSQGASSEKQKLHKGASSDKSGTPLPKKVTVKSSPGESTKSNSQSVQSSNRGDVRGSDKPKPVSRASSASDQEKLKSKSSHSVVEKSNTKPGQGTATGGEKQTSVMVKAKTSVEEKGRQSSKVESSSKNSTSASSQALPGKTKPPSLAGDKIKQQNTNTEPARSDKPAITSRDSEKHKTDPSKAASTASVQPLPLKVNAKPSSTGDKSKQAKGPNVNCVGSSADNPIIIGDSVKQETKASERKSASAASDQALPRNINAKVAFSAGEKRPNTDGKSAQSGASGSSSFSSSSSVSRKESHSASKPVAKKVSSQPASDSQGGTSGKTNSQGTGGPKDSTASKKAHSKPPAVSPSADIDSKRPNSDSASISSVRSNDSKGGKASDKLADASNIMDKDSKKRKSDSATSNKLLKQSPSKAKETVSVKSPLKPKEKSPPTKADKPALLKTVKTDKLSENEQRAIEKGSSSERHSKEEVSEKGDHESDRRSADHEEAPDLKDCDKIVIQVPVDKSDDLSDGAESIQSQGRIQRVVKLKSLK